MVIENTRFLQILKAMKTLPHPKKNKNKRNVTFVFGRFFPADFILRVTDVAIVS